MDMMIFYAVAGLLLIAGSLCWLLAVRINPQTDLAEQQALAQEQVSGYRLRLKALEREAQANELDEQEHLAAVNDLKHQLLHDLTVQQTDGSRKKLPLFWPGMVFLLLFVGVFYTINGEAPKLHNWQQAKQSLPEYAKRAFTGEGETLSAKELQQLALGLRTKLHQSGDDPQAWMAFGRVAMTINDSDSALLALEKAYRLSPDNNGIVVNYAQTLMVSGDSAKAAPLLAKVLETEPENIEALMLVAYMAEQRGEITQAQIAWLMIQERLKPDDRRYQYVTEKLTQSQGVADSTGAQVAAEGAAGGAKIKVTLTLAESLKDKLPTDGTLFIYAKAAQGRPMPAAVIKLAQFSLPMSVELSDANAMLQNYTLSSLDNVVIWARVSVDGDIGISAGELQGHSEVLSVADTESVTVVIDQIL